MTDRVSRRRLLGLGAGVALRLGLLGAAVEAGTKTRDLLEQQDAWAQASEPNDAFLARHASRLRALALGGSFAPEQWPLTPEGQAQALRGLDLAVRELGMKEMRLGLRWSRASTPGGGIDLRWYAPFLDYCLGAGAELCLNVGPIRTFRWPEEHVPKHLSERLPGLLEQDATIGPDDPLAHEALAYLDRLLDALRREYGASPAGLRAFQVENEPFYRFGKHRWLMSVAYVEEAMRRVDAAYPGVDLLLTSAGRLNLREIRDVFARLLDGGRPRYAGRLVSGFDFHYRTPRRDSIPLVRYFDQLSYAQPFAQTPEGNIRDARSAGLRIEVSEGQAEPALERFDGVIEPQADPSAAQRLPGNSARDFRYMLTRCIDRILDPRAPGLIRVWGVEALTKKMLAGSLTEEHRAIIALVQAVNAAGPEAAPVAERAR